MCHAIQSELDRFDSMQRGFLHAIHLNDRVAFLEYNFAPRSTRRDISMLGLIHKRVLGLAHPAYSVLLPFYNGSVQARYHLKSIDNRRPRITHYRELYNRSIFGYVDTSNRLPQYIVDCKSVKDFQHGLTVICRRRCRHGIESWMHSFNMYRRDFDPSVFNVDPFRAAAL